MSSEKSSSLSESTPEPQAAPGRFPPWYVCLLVATLLITIPLVRVQQDEIQLVIRYFDNAAANIATLILSFLAFMAVYIWLVWWSGYTFTTRRVAFLLPIAVVVFLLIALRFEGVDGAMVPTYSWRWTKQHEDRLREANRPAPIAPVNTGYGEHPASKSVAHARNADLETETPRDFPQFLGPQRNNHLADVTLAEEWNSKPPKELWRRDIGPSWAGFSARNGFAVTIEQHDQEEWTTCYRVDDGELVWKFAVQARHYNPLGGLGPRATPTIDGGRVYSLGATGILSCLDGATGKEIWRKGLLDMYGLKQSRSEQLVMWGRAGSPLIVGDKVVVGAGGDGDRRRSLVAFYKETGKVAWEGGDDQISYASPVLATIGGVQQIVSVNEVTMSGHDIATGKVLWSHPWYGNSAQDANVSQAFPVAGDRVFVSKGYGIGSMLLQLRNDGNQKFAAEPLWESPRVMKTKFTNPTIIDGYVYGLSDGILECIELESGKSQWKAGRYGHGQILGVGSQLLVLAEDGRLALVAASPDKFQERAKLQALEGKTWNNLCLTGKRLLIRNGTQAVCYELP